MASLANQRTLLKNDLSGAASAPSPRKRMLVEGAGTVGMMAMYAAFIVGTSVWWPIAPIMLGTGVGAGMIAALRRRPAIATVDALAAVTAPRAVTRTGIAHRLNETVKSITGNGSHLAEEILVSNDKGVLFRRISAAPFLLELDDGGKLVVLGTVRVVSPSVFIDQIKKGDPHATALGLAGVPIKGELLVKAVREGDHISVTGEPNVEVVPELAFHRDAGEVLVMRGRAKAVVVIRAT